MHIMHVCFYGEFRIFHIYAYLRVVGATGPEGPEGKIGNSGSTGPRGVSVMCVHTKYVRIHTEREEIQTYVRMATELIT